MKNKDKKPNVYVMIKKRHPKTGKWKKAKTYKIEDFMQKLLENTANQVTIHVEEPSIYDRIFKTKKYKDFVKKVASKSYNLGVMGTILDSWKLIENKLG